MVSSWGKIAVLVCLMAVFVPAMSSAAVGDDSVYCEISENVYVPCLFEGENTLAGSKTFGGLVGLILNILVLVVGSISVLFLIIGGFRYLTAAGNEETAEQAKGTMKHAIVGLIIVIMSFAVIYIVTQVLAGGGIA